MKKCIEILIVALFFAQNALGQTIVTKPYLDEASYGGWEHLQDYSISGNGEYLWYQIGSKNGESALIIKNLKSKMVNHVRNGKLTCFTEDSRFILYMVIDTLYIVDLKSNKKHFFLKVNNFQLNKNQLLISNNDNDLIILNIDSWKKCTYKGVYETILNDQKTVLLLKTQSSILLVDLLTNKTEIIFEGNQSMGFKFDNSGTKVAFIATNYHGEREQNSIMLFKKGMKRAEVYLRDENIKINLGKYYLLKEKLSFNIDGNLILFKVGKEFLPIKINESLASVDVWNYKDIHLQSYQLATASNNQEKKYDAIFNIKKSKVVLLCDSSENLIKSSFSNQFFIVERPYNVDSFYDNKQWPQLSIIDGYSGKKHSVIYNSCSSFAYIGLSPDEGFLVWFDYDKKTYYSYETRTGIIRDISKSIKFNVYDSTLDMTSGSAYGTAGWIKGKNSILIYGKYDIWEVDLLAKKKPINLTLGKGENNKLIFSIAQDNLKDCVHNSIKEILLAAYNRETKNNGFWKMKIDSPNLFMLSEMAPYAYCIPRIPMSGRVDFAQTDFPVKSKHTNVYVLTRMSATESKNIFITKDFRSFSKESDVQPEKKYNWLTVELVNWRMNDHRESQGILYKPENFDSTKKYPVILNFYEKRSDEFHQYLIPDYSQGVLDIPTYVSNGYIVFVPDIYYSYGKGTTEGTIRCVVSAVRQLFKYKFIDSTRVGIQGHSFGGAQTISLIANTNLFAAACEVAGVSDRTSAYGQLGGGGYIRQGISETGQGNFGYNSTPWTNPQLYIEGSSIYKIGQITTPLLMVHNKEDMSVPFAQAIQFFTGLRRAGKKVWLLQYDNNGHTLSQEASKIDFTVRLRQFFDFYLKNGLPPKWMTRGVPAVLKGTENILTMDTTNTQP